MTDHEATGGLANVDTVVAVGGMAQDPFVFFVEGVHGRPSERDPRLQLASSKAFRCGSGEVAG
jgi:hypothetical protein